MKSPGRAAKEEIEESLGEILRIAMKDPSYMMIFVGFAGNFQSDHWFLY